jgi:hypothetical protein
MMMIVTVKIIVLWNVTLCKVANRTSVAENTVASILRVVFYLEERGSKFLQKLLMPVHQTTGHHVW